MAHAAITSITDAAATTTGSRLNLLNALINETSARLKIDSLGPASETAAAVRGPDPVSYTHLTLPTNREV